MFKRVIADDHVRDAGGHLIERFKDLDAIRPSGRYRRWIDFNADPPLAREAVQQPTSAAPEVDDCIGRSDVWCKLPCVQCAGGRTALVMKGEVFGARVTDIPREAATLECHRVVPWAAQQSTWRRGGDR